jgi:acetyltransferase-like isoleucine patch superfamily enzyme
MSSENRKRWMRCDAAKLNFKHMFADVWRHRKKSLFVDAFSSARESKSMKWRRLIRALPHMVKLLWHDCRDAVGRLYLRASWKLEGLTLSPSARMFYENRGQIRVQGRCSVGPFSVIIAKATDGLCGVPLLSIGERTYIGDQVNLRATGGTIKIGSDVLIANHVTIVASNHGMILGRPMIDQEWSRGDIVIEDDVWVSAGVVVLPGSIIRRGAVVAAGAVVRGEVPSNAIYGGVPARQIGERK